MPVRLLSYRLATLLQGLWKGGVHKNWWLSPNVWDAFGEDIYRDKYDFTLLVFLMVYRLILIINLRQSMRYVLGLVLVVLVFMPAGAKTDSQGKCNVDGIDSCRILSSMYHNGAGGFPIDKSRAIALKERRGLEARTACDAGEYAFCLEYLTIVLEEKHDFNKDWFVGEEVTISKKAEAADWVETLLNESCDTDDIEGCAALLVFYTQSEVTRFLMNQSEAVSGDIGAVLDDRFKKTEALKTRVADIGMARKSELEDKCGAGDAKACQQFAGIIISSKLMAMHKVTTQEDINSAYRAASKSCFAGFLPGCTNLSIVFGYFPLDQQLWLDTKQAAEASCLNGNVVACDFRLDFGSSIFLDADDKLDLIKHSCAIGSGLACDNLAVKAMKRFSDSKSDADAQEALQYYRAGCNASLLMACHYVEHWPAVKAFSLSR